MDQIVGLLGLVISTAVYFLPTIIGGVRKKRNLISIGLLNFFLGWTVIGWIIALIWAFAHEDRR